MHKYTSDGQLKHMILSAIDSGCLKSRQIFNYIKYPDYPVFRVEMANLRRRGYISKIGTKPFDFKMTKKGLFHFQHPNAAKEYKQLKNTLQFNKFMENRPEFKRAVAQYADKMNHSPISSIISPHNSPNQPIQDFGTDDNPNIEVLEYQQIINEQKADIKELKNRNFNLNNHIQKQNKQKPITQNQQRKNKKVNELEMKRKNLVRRYADHYKGYNVIPIDSNFFKIWGNMNAYLLKHFQLFKKGSIEIMSTSNKEHERKHTKDFLDDNELYKGQFGIEQITNTGIWIYGSGMAQPQFLKYNYRTKTPPKYWIKPT